MSYSREQLQTLTSIADAFLPKLEGGELEDAKARVKRTIANPQWEPIEKYLQQSCVEDEGFQAAYTDFVSKIPAKGIVALGGFIDMLGGGPAGVPITGTETKFADLNREERTKIIQGWAASDNELLRGVFGSLKRLITIPHLRNSETAFAAMEYPDHRLSRLSVSQMTNKPHEYNFKSLGSEQEADIVIIGSGAGGGVVAAKLAAEFGTDKKILVLEKGASIPQEDFPVTQAETGRVYDGDLGVYMTEDDTGIIQAGACWGGGTVVNWSGLLELPQDVRDEWANEYGLNFINTPAFQACIDRVSRRSGVTTENVVKNTPNQLVTKGAELLGLNTQIVPQNTQGKEHNCGLCTMGCPSGVKQGTHVSFLVDAEKNGAVCVQNCEVTEIITSLDERSGRAVTGVKAVVDGTRDVIIKAPVVVCCAGGILSPNILQKSKLENNKIGQNLRVHPVMDVVGYYYDREIKPWDGAIMTTLVTPSFAHPEHEAYRAKILCRSCQPSHVSWAIPWADPVSWKTEVLRHKSSAWTIVNVRDRDSSGKITLDEVTGKPLLSYTLGESDRKTRTETIIDCCKIHVAAGCDEVRPMIHLGDQYTEPYKARKGTSENPVNDPSMEEYAESLRINGTGMKWTSAHPMGTCQMGTKPENSAVDLDGMVWGCQGLYVADASIFPTATGVNPALTVLAMADWVAGRIVTKLQERSL